MKRVEPGKIVYSSALSEMDCRGSPDEDKFPNPPLVKVPFGLYLSNTTVIDADLKELRHLQQLTDLNL